MPRFLGIVPPQVTLFGQAARPQPPMGLAYAMNGVAAAGWKPALLDCCAEGYDTVVEDAASNWRVTGLDFGTIVERVRELAPDAIGVALGVSTDHDIVQALVARLRQAFPSLPIVLGGSQASLMRERVFIGLPIERIEADFVVTGRDLGSGEVTIEHLLRYLAGHGSLEHVPGLLYRTAAGTAVTAPVSVTAQTLGALGRPRRDLFAVRDGMDIYSRINRSHTGPAELVPYAVMHTSRGCGGACVFCHIQYQGFDGTLVRREASDVRGELRTLRSRGYRTISIEDDNFGGFNERQTQFALTVLDEVAQAGFECLYFPNGLTLRSMTAGACAILRKLRSLADSGIRVRNSLPIESGDDRTLREIIRKPHSLMHVETALRELEDGYLHHPNLDFDAFFMVGIVSVDEATGRIERETLDSIDKTISLARRCGEMGLRVNAWWMKPNPGGPQYALWRDLYPEKPFYELQFLFPSGIWGSEEEEYCLDHRIRALNADMEADGHGSLRPIYPVTAQPADPLLKIVSETTSARALSPSHLYPM